MSYEEYVCVLAFVFFSCVHVWFVCCCLLFLLWLFFLVGLAFYAACLDAQFFVLLLGFVCCCWHVPFPLSFQVFSCFWLFMPHAPFLVVSSTWWVFFLVAFCFWPVCAFICIFLGCCLFFSCLFWLQAVGWCHVSCMVACARGVFLGVFWQALCCFWGLY